MEDVIIKVDKKKNIPRLILLTLILIIWIGLLIISIIYNVIGYTIYCLLLIFLNFIIRLYLEIKWINDVYITFKKETIIINTFQIKKAKGKLKEKLLYIYRPFTRNNGANALSGGYLTSYAIIEKIEIKYNDITNYEIIKNRDLEIKVDNKKVTIYGNLFYYQNIKNKWKSVYSIFTKEQIQNIYNELEQRIDYH